MLAADPIPAADPEICLAHDLDDPGPHVRGCGRHGRPRYAARSLCRAATLPGARRSLYSNKRSRSARFTS